MQYFVSIEDTSYQAWQVELLIESFKLHGLEDSLVIGVANSTAPKYKNFSRNLQSHNRKFSHQNYGREREYLPLNKNYGLYAALKNKMLEQPFCVIDPDMVLARPVPLPVEDITFHLNWLFSPELAEKHGVFVRNRIVDLLLSRGFPDQSLWFPMGSVYTFNNVPEELFLRAIHWTESLELERLRHLLKVEKEYEFWNGTGKAGWMMAMLDCYGTLNFRGEPNYEMALVENNSKANFIHYTKGLPPVWSKYMYRYEPPDVLCMGADTPFEVLLENNPTTTTNYLQFVIRSYLKGN